MVMRRFVLCAAAFVLLAVGCSKDKNRDGQGLLRLKFPEQTGSMTRAALEIPDTNDFILEIKGADGSIVYEGSYGMSPETMSVKAGSYSIGIRSEKFQVPQFGKPVFGDDQVVVVPAGGSVCTVMNCSQTNAGIRLNVSPDFLTAYPQGVLLLRSDKGRLNYSYREKRYAYFHPGKVSLVLVEGADENVLLTRYMEAADMLTLNINVAGRQESPDRKGISVHIDTSRIWTSGDFTIGEEDSKGGTDSNAMTVAQAKESIGMKDVWVTGYIVGGDMTTGEEGISFCEPFTKASHLAIASRGSVLSKSSCIAVELPAGAVREALNLVSHPELIGRRVSLQGDIEEKYLGTTGLKGVSDFVLH